MPDPTQTGFFFKIGDAASPEVFTQLEGMRQVPEIPGDQRTTRPARTVGDSGSTITHKFNALREGAEFDVPCDYLPNDTQQEALITAVGSDTGINLQTGIVGSTYTVTYAFNVLVLAHPVAPADPNDANAVDMVTFKLKINGDVTRTKTMNA